MLTAITYNCSPETLDEISQTAFGEAFENDIRVKPIYRDVEVNVTFKSGRSRVTNWCYNEDEPDMDFLHDEFAYLAERAFSACCAEAE